MLQKRTLLCKENLRECAYLEDLLAEGERVGLLTENETARIQYDCLELLAVRLRSAYGRQGSSVPDEVAGELLESVLYTVSLALKAAPDPDAAICMLTKTSVPFLYERGLRYSRLLLRDVRVIANELQENETPAFNPFYRAVIRRDLPAFVTRYDPEKKAHDRMFFPVYSVAAPPNGLAGVEYVRAYAQALLAETRFCNLFDRAELAYVLSSPRARNENVFYTVLRCASVSVLALGTVGLRTSADDARFVRDTFDAADAERQLCRAFAPFPFAFSALRAIAKELCKA